MLWANFINFIQVLLPLFDLYAGWLWLRMFYPSLSTPAKDSQDVWMVPKVAGRSCQWIEAEGRGSAAGTPPFRERICSWNSTSICLLFILLDGWGCCSLLALLRENKFLINLFYFSVFKGIFFSSASMLVTTIISSFLVNFEKNLQKSQKRNISFSSSSSHKTSKHFILV